jgi:PhzF family phenazine biosynthesis protein
MTTKFFIVDAFTDRPFSGNPAAVCLLETPKPDKWRQSVAQEFNLSETAFVEISNRASLSLPLRWFTPTVEVDLCGHATLACTHVLLAEGLLKPNDAAVYATKSGELTARQNGTLIELDFPSEKADATTAPPELLAGLGTSVRFVSRNRFDFLVELANEDAVRSLKPDFSLLMQLPGRGVIVTSPAKGEEYDFVSRFFAPKLGVMEDPVCGSAHCALAPYWGERTGKTELVGYQASARGGVVYVRYAGLRTLLGGKAVTVACGELS